MADCPRDGCGLTHVSRTFTQNGYLFECPNGHQWVREDETIDAAGALETQHISDARFGDHVHVSRADGTARAVVHAQDEDGNFLVTVPDILRVRVEGRPRSTPRVSVAPMEHDAELLLRDPERALTALELGNRLQKDYQLARRVSDDSPLGGVFGDPKEDKHDE